MKHDSAAQSVAHLMEDGAAIDASIRRAFEETVLRHRRLGIPLVAWRDGRVTEVPAEALADRSDSQVADEPAENA